MQNNEDLTVSISSVPRKAELGRVGRCPTIPTRWTLAQGHPRHTITTAYAPTGASFGRGRCFFSLT
jgi:hypothetical protein